MPFVGSLSKSWTLVIGLALAFAYNSWSTGLEIKRLKADLGQAYIDKGLTDAAFNTAVTFNKKLNATVESMSQQLHDVQVADDWMRQFNASMDSKLESTVLDLGKLFDEKPKDYSSGCDERFSDGVYQRMLQHYNARKGDSVPD